MPDPYTEYLNLRGVQSDPYSDYLNLSQIGVEDPYEEYLRLLSSDQQSVVPDYDEITPLTPRDPVGFFGALGRGFASGATLGYVEN